MSIEIRHLRQFVAVAEELHFTRAADRLRIAQPALSAQIRRLEEQLQIPLFERSTRLVRLTPQGHAFYAAARAAVESWDASLIVAASLRTGEAGGVLFGISLRIQSRVRGSIQTRLDEINPRATVDFIAEGSLRLVEEVAAGRLDAALCIAPTRSHGVRYQLVRNDPMIAALPTSHPLAGQSSVALSDLRDDAWILPSNRVGTNAFLREMCRDGGFEMRISSAPSADYDDEFTAVAAGKGIEVAPLVVVPQRPIAGVVFVPVDVQAVPLEIVYHSETPSAPLSAVIRAVLESLGTVEVAVA